MNREIEVCSHCGAKMYKYQHRLNKQMCRALFVLYQVGKTANIAQIGLSHNQICNFQKLRYWNLVEKKGGGDWKITTTGKEFCEDIIAVPVTVKTYRGERCMQSPDLVRISQVLGTEWKKLVDYIGDREPVIRDDSGQVLLFQERSHVRE